MRFAKNQLQSTCSSLRNTLRLCKSAALQCALNSVWAVWYEEILCTILVKLLVLFLLKYKSLFFKLFFSPPIRMFWHLKRMPKDKNKSYVLLKSISVIFKKLERVLDVGSTS